MMGAADKVLAPQRPAFCPGIGAHCAALSAVEAGAAGCVDKLLLIRGPNFVASIKYNMDRFIALQFRDLLTPLFITLLHFLSKNLTVFSTCVALLA